MWRLNGGVTLTNETYRAVMIALTITHIVISIIKLHG
jgi:hypothetical protein